MCTVGNVCMWKANNNTKEYTFEKSQIAGFHMTSAGGQELFSSMKYSLYNVYIFMYCFYNYRRSILRGYFTLFYLSSNVLDLIFMFDPQLRQLMLICHVIEIRQ